MPRVALPALDRALIERSDDGLYRMIRYAWPLVEPGPYIDNWHIPVICEYLQAVSKGEIQRLVINVPPSCMKSLTVGVFWPLWDWTEHPARKWIYASYDASLARRDGVRTLKILQSDWWQARWPDVRPVESKPSAADFTLVSGGFRFATSVEGKVTGRHGDGQVVDDPIKPKDVSGSAAVTRKAITMVSQWWRETMSSRAVDPITFFRVIVMQRLHEDDLAGEMLREGGWTHLCLPMRRERTTSLGDTRAQEGDLLWPARFPESVVKHLEQVEMGPAVAAAQLQQRPTPVGGGVFHKGWFRWYHTKAGVPVPVRDQYPCRDTHCVVAPDKGTWLQSWDMTFKKSDGSDFVAGQVWQRDGSNYYLRYSHNRRLSFIDTCKVMLEVSTRYPLALTKLIEDKANGPAVEDTLKHQLSGIVLVNPQGGKEARANAISGLFEAGNIHLPHPDLAPWVWDYIVQMTTFPRGVNDDMVDATSQALIHLALRYVPYAEAMRAVQKEIGR